MIYLLYIRDGHDLRFAGRGTKDEIGDLADWYENNGTEFGDILIVPELDW